MTGVDWGPGLIVLALGLMLGGLVLWRVTAAAGKAATARRVAIDRPDLEAQRDGLFQQLRELDDTSAKRTPEQLARERYAIELQAAGVLLALEEHEASSGRKPERETAGERSGRSVAAAESPHRDRSSIRGFLWGVGSASALGLLLFLVSRGSHPREEGSSSTSSPMGRAPAITAATGNATTGGADDASDEELARYRAALERNPEDLETRVDLARVYLGRQDLMAVWNETQYVLARAPDHPRALAYQALVRLAMGQAELAVEMLKKAKAGAPDLLEPYLHLSLAYVRMGRMADAEATMAEARKRFPDQAATLVKLMAEMKAQMAEGPPSLPGDPHASVPAPGSSVAPPLASAPSSTGAGDAGSPAPVAASGTGVAGTLELDPSLQASPRQPATVFITLRAAGVASGPPIAVKRLPSGSFPLAFSIGAADSMMGQELPERVRIEARADADGDPMTRPASDPVGVADDVRLGTSNLRLVLKR